MARLLLVESDPFMQRMLQDVLSAEKHWCIVASDGTEARTALAGGPFDLVLLDIGRLRPIGLELLRQIRAEHHTPILLLAPSSGVADIVAGLEIGADDYLCEPFDMRELLGRVRAQLRRADEYSRPMEPGDRFDLGGIVLDVSCRDAFREGAAVHLTRREFEVLHLLARNRGKALATRWIFQHIWGYAAKVGSKALAVQVGRLRRKIETDPHHPVLLLSVRGIGYKLA